ncbi:MAG: hypothetical protein IJZ03_09335 [Clostridia bacterium]|nr:hypothetical protein [Clostridia bacterium]MBQ8743553.1 hypothetical protein [Clostridia bacterium]
MEFMLGVNYWGRDYGTEMWLHYDPQAIRNEMKQLYDCGVRCMRVFPNWRDFQPIEKAYGHLGRFVEYVNSHDGRPVYGDGVDMDRIEEFHDFCQAAQEVGMTLVVSIVTGWMSGRLFVPPAISGKNPILDPEALVLTRRYVHRFVKELKNEKSIIMWDLGNESNCMGPVGNPFDAYKWASTVVDSIRAEDNTRPISSGMHALDFYVNWKIVHQGELCDVLTTHPYPSPTIGGNKEPYTRLRTTFIPTAQTIYYSGLSKRPAYIQESGTFTETIGSLEMSADFMRIQILSSLSNGLLGYQWWCAWDQSHLDFSPYTWSIMEEKLGLFDANGDPKPVAHVMKSMSKTIEGLPSPFPKRKSDGFCILSYEMNQQNNAMASLTFGKQAGIDLDVVFSEGERLPDSDLYFLPSITGWSILRKGTWEELLDRVDKGATLCISYDGGHMIDLPKVLGAESMGVMMGVSHSIELDGKRVPYRGNEILMKPLSAEVLLENGEGNPVFLKNKYGNGYIYFINFSPENLSFDTPDGFNKFPFYLMYKEVAREWIEKKPILVDDRNIGITVNPESESESLVTLLNYSDKDIVPEIRVNGEYEIKEILYGNTDLIPKCDGVILRVKKK